MAREKVTLDVVIKQVLEPEDDGFEEAARKYGLFMPTGWQNGNTFFESAEHMPPDDPDFSATLEEVLERGLYATVRVPEE